MSISIGIHDVQPAKAQSHTLGEDSFTPGRQFVTLDINDAGGNNVSLFFDTPEDAHAWAMQAAQAVLDGTMPAPTLVAFAEEAPGAPTVTIKLGGNIDMTAEFATEFEVATAALDANQCAHVHSMFTTAAADPGSTAEFLDPADDADEICGEPDPGDEDGEVGDPLFGLGCCERPVGHDGNHRCTDGPRITFWPNARPGAYPAGDQ